MTDITVINITNQEQIARFTVDSSIRNYSIPAKSRITVSDDHVFIASDDFILESELPPPTVLNYATITEMVINLPFPLTSGTQIIIKQNVFIVNDQGRLLTKNGTRVEPYQNSAFDIFESLSSYTELLVEMIDIRNDLVSEIEDATDATLVALGLDQVSNISAANMPVSTAQQTALDGKAPLVHTHSISGITGLQTTLDGKSALVHTHAISEVTGLQTALDAKAILSHNHTILDVTGLQTALDDKALSTHVHAITDITGLEAAIDGKSDVGHAHNISDIIGLQTALDGKALSSHIHAISNVTGLQVKLDTLTSSAIPTFEEETYQTGVYSITSTHTISIGSSFLFVVNSQNTGPSFLSVTVGVTTSPDIELLTSSGDSLTVGYLKPGVYLVTRTLDGAIVTTLNGNLVQQINTLNSYLTTSLAGKFTSGTNLLPGICSATDTNTGFFWPASDTLGITIGGTQIGSFLNSEFQLNVPLNGTSVVSDVNDSTTGRLLKVGSGGWLGLATIPAANTNWSSTLNSRIIAGVESVNQPLDKPIVGNAYIGMHLSHSVGRWGEIVIQLDGTSNPTAYIRSLSGGVTTSWSKIISASDLVESSKDKTASKILNTGYAGLGTAMALGAIDNLNSFDFSGFAYNPLSINTSGNNYPVASPGALIHVDYDSTHAAQIFSKYTGLTGTDISANELYFRNKGGEGWAAWAKIFHNGNVLGTVSHNLGIPTGSIIERGTNANGEYIKFTDGTLIAWRAGFLSQSVAANTYVESTWTLPASFATSPTPVIISSLRSANDATSRESVARNGGVIAEIITSSSAVVGMVNKDVTSRQLIADVFVVGRWY